MIEVLSIENQKRIQKLAKDYAKLVKELGEQEFDFYFQDYLNNEMEN